MPRGDRGRPPQTPADDTAGQGARVLPPRLPPQSILSRSEGSTRKLWLMCELLLLPVNLPPQSAGGLSPASKQLRLSLFNPHQEFLGTWQAWKHPSWHSPSRQHLSYRREDHGFKRITDLRLGCVSGMKDLLAVLKNQSQVSSLQPFLLQKTVVKKPA